MMKMHESLESVKSGPANSMYGDVGRTSENTSVKYILLKVVFKSSINRMAKIIYWSLYSIAKQK